MNGLLEKLAELEHEQWCEWSMAIAGDIDLLMGLLEMAKLAGFQLVEEDENHIKSMEERLRRWEKLWVPYEELSEEMKESDREYARRIMEALK